MLVDIGAYFSQHSSEFLRALVQHILVALAAVGLAGLIGFPLGVVSARLPRVRSFVTGLFSTLRVVPSLAILFLFVVLTGSVGVSVAILALTLLALPPILINTTVAFAELPQAAPIEAAAALGLHPVQIFRFVKIPLALPLVLTGIKTATTEVIASATLAAYVGGGGLGTIIFTGLGLMRSDYLLIGGASVAILGLAAAAILNTIEYYVCRWRLSN